MLKRFIFICVAILSLHEVVFADMKASDITPVMTQKIDSATSLIRANKGSQSKIVSKLYEIFDPVFDYELMARLSLGFRQYKSLSKSQQTIFAKEFENRLKSSFADSLKLYSDEKVTIEGLKSGKKNRKFLQTKLVGKNNTYQIDYKFYSSKSHGWVIYDVDIGTVSIIQSYRNQFANILEDEGFEKLMKMLKSAKINVEK